jgi:nitroreductase
MMKAHSTGPRRLFIDGVHLARSSLENILSARTTDSALAPLFLDRWSPRAFDGSALAKDELRAIIDAARWAPSAFNYQPWRLLYAVRGDANWERFLNILIPSNRGWAQHAGALFFILSDTLMVSPAGEESPSKSHSFDAGAAWAQMALQATHMGLHAHGMLGLDFDLARKELAVPERYRIEAAVAIGRRGDPATLHESLRAREMPSDRKPIEDIAFAGNFPA